MVPRFLLSHSQWHLVLWLAFSCPALFTTTLASTPSTAAEEEEEDVVRWEPHTRSQGAGLWSGLLCPQAGLPKALLLLALCPLGPLREYCPCLLRRFKPHLTCPMEGPFGVLGVCPGCWLGTFVLYRLQDFPVARLHASGLLGR